MSLKLSFPKGLTDHFNSWQAGAWQSLKNNVAASWMQSAIYAQTNASTSGVRGNIQASVSGGNAPFEPIKLVMQVVNAPGAIMQEFGAMFTGGKQQVQNQNPQQTPNPLTNIGFLLEALIIPQSILRAAAAIFFDDIGADEEGFDKTVDSEGY